MRQRCYQALRDHFSGEPLEIKDTYPNEILISIAKGLLPEVCGFLAGKLGCSLVMMVANDERPLDGVFRLYYLFSVAGADLFITVRTDVAPEEPFYPSVTPVLPAAHWYEREAKDMFGLKPLGHPDLRRLVLHQNWPRGIKPMRKDFQPDRQVEKADRKLPFTKVEGDGVFQVPVGPIHAGIIEPGHFRFSTVGENVINLEARLFYTHKGTEKLAENKHYEEVLFIAERICGVCAFSHATAYCQAVERLAGVTVPPRAQYIRTIALELERLYNHIGDVGNICAGVGFAFGTSHCLRLKEDLMQFNDRVCGSRFLRGLNRVGGVRTDLSPSLLAEMVRLLDRVEAEFKEVTGIMLANSILVNRIETTGVVPYKTAVELGVVGPAARASGVTKDMRLDHPHAAYPNLDFTIPVYQTGDVAARLKVRIDEVFISINLIRQAAKQMPDTPLAVDVKELPPYRTSLGYAESPRGSDLHWIMTGENNTIYRYGIRSASFCNWPAVALAVPGNIVPDFPLINKSFELCYSCLDR